MQEQIIRKDVDSKYKWVLEDIYPSIDKILNIVDSKYALVYIVSDRAKQMTRTGYYQKPIKEYKSKKNIGRALEEVYDGLIHIEKH